MKIVIQNGSKCEVVERSAVKYVAIGAAPRVHRWDVPRACAGQIVEVSYGEPFSHSDEAGFGSLYRRVHDRSDNSVTYYRREVV